MTRPAAPFPLVDALRPGEWLARVSLRIMRSKPFVALMLVVAGAGGCSNDPAASLLNVNAVDVVFLTQSERQDAVMDALFTGRVLVDAAKCTRLDDPDGATVIWPVGFTVSGENGDLRVLDGDGREVGRLGGSFRIGGGEVTELNPQLHISYMDRAFAAEHCPGRYWIASEVQ